MHIDYEKNTSSFYYKRFEHMWIPGCPGINPPYTLRENSMYAWVQYQLFHKQVLVEHLFV